MTSRHDAAPGPTVYDTGEMLEPPLWADVPPSGRVDFDDSEGRTALTIWAHPSTTLADTTVLGIDAPLLDRLRIMVNDGDVAIIERDGALTPPDPETISGAATAARAAINALADLPDSGDALLELESALRIRVAGYRFPTLIAAAAPGPALWCPVCDRIVDLDAGELRAVDDSERWSSVDDYDGGGVRVYQGDDDYGDVLCYLHLTDRGGPHGVTLPQEVEVVWA